MTGYVIEATRLTPAGNVVYQIVTSDWQRRSVTIPYKRATADNIAAVIEHALANVERPVKPL